MTAAAGDLQPPAWHDDIPPIGLDDAAHAPPSGPAKRAALRIVHSSQVADGDDAVPAALPRAYMPPTCDARDGLYGLAPLTEVGNAARMVMLHGGDIRYVVETATWLVWQGADDGGHWVNDVDGAMVRTLAAGLAKSIYIDAGQNLMDAKYFVEWARKSQTKTTIDHAVSLLSDRPEIRVPFAAVDGDPLLVGLDGAKQVIDLRTGIARPATRADLVTKSLGCSRVGAAENAGRWKNFIRQIFQDDPALIGWVNRFLGYMLTGCVSEEVFVFCHGGGANGKSVLITTISELMGDYCRTIQPESLMVQNRNAGAASSDLARLAGARLVVGNETEAGRPLAEATVKMLTGGKDNITARKLYAEEIEFKPCLKLVLAGNHKPVIRGTDPAIWRRVRLLPFSVEFRMGNKTSPSDMRPLADRSLISKLNDEREDILAYLIEGCLDWQRGGLGDTPAIMQMAVDDYRVEQDVLGGWIAERTDPTGATLATTLYLDYKGWAELGGQRPMSIQAFGRRLAERGYAKNPVRRGSEYSGISLAKSEIGPF